MAPPGAGKTTLLARVVAASRTETSWYTASSEDADESALVRYLGQSLLAEGAASLADDTGVDGLLEMLGDAAAGPRLLVIDDLHEIIGTSAEAALARFLAMRPASVRVLLAARRPPTFNTPRMLASGDLVELSGDDLRFRSWEVDELFRTVYREPLAPEAAALLCRRVGGLAAALQLFHLSVRGLNRSERESEIAHLNGRSRLIRSYLTRTVLEGLAPERRDFLLRTSTLGVLEGTLCDDLLDRCDSAEVLRGLESEQLFTTTPDGVTYHYHQVLRDHLEVVLEDEFPAGAVTALHARAAGLLERAGHGAEALRAYRRAGDWSAAARLVRGSGVADSGAVTSVTSDVLVAEQNDPWLALARIRRLLRQGSIEAALTGLKQVEASADDPDLAGHCARERLQASVWRGKGASRALPERSPMVALRSLTQTVQFRHAVGPDRQWGLVCAIAQMLAGRLSRARLELDRVYPRLEDGSWARVAAGLLSVMFDIGDPGQRQHCREALEDLSLTADVQGYPWLARVARCVQACVVLEVDGQRWHLAACHRAIEACQLDEDRWGELVIRAVTAVALARQGEAGEARSHLDHAAALGVELNAPVLELWVRALALAVDSAGEPDAPARVPILTRLAKQVGLDDVEGVLAACRVSVHRRGTEGAAVRGADRDRLECLGGFRLHHDQEFELTSLRPRARLLLMLLAVHHGVDVHRETLIAGLWPDATLDAGTRRLQVAVSSIRRVLEDHGLVATVLRRHGDAYGLHLPEAWVDIRELERGVVELEKAGRTDDPVALADRAAEVMRIYRGDLLPEVGAAEWVLPERERLRIDTATALSTAARQCLELGRAELALRPAQRVVELDPLRDSAWLVLARAQRDVGDHSAARATLEEHDRVCSQLSVPGLGRPTVGPPPGATHARA